MYGLQMMEINWILTSSDNIKSTEQLKKQRNAWSQLNF